MEDILVEFYDQVIADSPLGEVLGVLGDFFSDFGADELLLDSDFGAEGAEVLASAGLVADNFSVFSDGGVVGEISSSEDSLASMFQPVGDAGVMDISAPGEATAIPPVEDPYVQIQDSFSDLDADGTRDSLQLSGLDMDGSGMPDSVELNVDGDLNGVCDSIQHGFDSNGNGLADRYDIGVDSDGNGIPDSVQRGGFDLDGNGIKDVASYKDIIQIQSGVPLKWF